MARSLERRFRRLLENITDTVTILDREARIQATTGQLKPILGYPPEFWATRTAFDLCHPDERDRAAQALAAVIAEPRTEVHDELRARHADGHWELLEVVGVNMLDDPDVQGIVLTTRNITERKRADLLLAGQARALELIARGADLSEGLGAVRALIEAAHDDVCAAVLVVEAQTGLRVGSAGGIPADALGALEATDHDEGGAWAERTWDLRETLVDDLAAGGADALPGAPALGAAGKHRAWTLPVVDRTRAELAGVLLLAFDRDRPPTDRDRMEAQVAANLAALAIERSRTEARLEHQAMHDALTGLPNRSLLLDRLGAALARAERQSHQVAVLFVDLDRFKVINDSLGHSIGDQLLVTLADRLRESVRPGDTVARFGGDEFVVVLEGPVDQQEAHAVAGRLEHELRDPFDLEGSEVFLTGSVGIAFAGPGTAAEEVLRNADTAMYRAKERGRDRVELFDDELRVRAVDRLRFESDLRRGLERDELVVHYQPTVDLQGGAIVGVEALVRWQHPDRGLLGPEHFVHGAIESGLIGALGRAVLERSVPEVRAWAEAEGLDPLPLLAVNLSARQLADPELAGGVRQVLDRHGWPPDRFLLELNETELLDEASSTIDALRDLRAEGVGLGIDDFGTGYSSLSYLHRLPVDLVKVDQAFISGLGSGAPGEAVTTAVVEMAHALGLTAVAEGIETEAQLRFLQELGCDWGQGFLFSEPVPHTHLGTWRFPEGTFG